jgi:hypothetical protein
LGSVTATELSRGKGLIAGLIPSKDGLLIIVTLYQSNDNAFPGRGLVYLLPDKPGFRP